MVLLMLGMITMVWFVYEKVSHILEIAMRAEAKDMAQDLSGARQEGGPVLREGSLRALLAELEAGDIGKKLDEFAPKQNVTKG